MHVFPHSFSTVALPLTEYLIEIQINSMDSSITDQLRNLLMFFRLPYTISDSTNITEINITTGMISGSALSCCIAKIKLYRLLILPEIIYFFLLLCFSVCSLNETQYQCKCEGLFVWPNDTCHSYEACDDITDGSCTCINGLPTDGQFCQCETLTSLCDTISFIP